MGYSLPMTKKKVCSTSCPFPFASDCFADYVIGMGAFAEKRTANFTHS